MTGASTAYQSPGNPGGFGGGFVGCSRVAKEYNSVSSAESSPDCGSMRRILMPLQKLAKTHPGMPLLIEGDVGINGVEVILARNEDDALARPE